MLTTLYRTEIYSQMQWKTGCTLSLLPARLKGIVSQHALGLNRAACWYI